MRGARRLAAGLALGLLAAASPCGAVAPSRDYATRPEKLGLAHQAVVFTTRDSVRLDGWWFAGPAGSAVVVLAGPGNGNQADLLGKVGELRKRGFTVMTFDYRGFGPRGAGAVDSLRHLVFSSMYVEDMAAALRFARVRAGDRPVYAYGQDMGSAVALAAYSEVGFTDGVVADGLFTLTNELLAAAGLLQDPLAVQMAKRHVRDEDEPIVACVRLRAPLFAILAERDSLMPARQGMLVAREARVRADTWIVPGAAHGETSSKAPDYFDRIARYFRRLQALPRAG